MHIIRLAYAKKNIRYFEVFLERENPVLLRTRGSNGRRGRKYLPCIPSITFDPIGVQERSIDSITRSAVPIPIKEIQSLPEAFKRDFSSFSRAEEMMSAIRKGKHIAKGTVSWSQPIDEPVIVAM